jgi:hypothetical protein
MRIYFYFIAFQLSVLMWGGAYYSVREIYQSLNASQSLDISFVSHEGRGDPN